MTLQSTPPYMAIEALLRINPKFVHKPEHDLELILYIILYMCTLVQGPGLPLRIPPASLPMCSWFNNGEGRDIGYRKLAHLQCYHTTIIPNFTPYWRDFAPFVEELIIASFPINARLPNKLRYNHALRILGRAYDFVDEPSLQISRVIEAQCLKWPSNTLLHQRSKKGKHTSSYS